MLWPDREELTSINGTGLPDVHPPAMDMLVSTGSLSRHLGDTDLVVLDCTVHTVATPERFTNRNGLGEYLRGQFPSAINISALDLIDEIGRHKPVAELDAMHDVDRDRRMITYCGSGIAALSEACVLTRLGFKDVAVYTASLREWAANADNPMAATSSSST